MSQPNEFSHYSLEVLHKKKKHFKKLQMFMMILTGASIVIVAVAALMKDNMQVFQLIPFLILAGVVFPLLIFGPIRKKIQLEIESRPASN